MPFNRLILRQDRRVVETQRPKPSALRTAEKLVRGDRPIANRTKKKGTSNLWLLAPSD